MMYTMPVIDMAATGRRICEIRKARGMSVREMQQIFGFSTPQAIYKWQHGVSMPTVDNMVVIASVFGVRIDDLIVVRS